MRLPVPALILGVLAVIVTSYRVWLPPLGEFLVVNDPLRPADAVLPLAGEPQRLIYAAELHVSGLAQRLLITPLPLATPESRERNVRRAVGTAGRLGVPADAITVVTEAGKSTFQEARNVRRLLEEQGLGSLIVVTSPWHTRRASIAFRDAFRGSGIEVSMHALPDEAYAYRAQAYRPEEWWTYKLGRDPTLSEYLKLAAYRFGIR